MSNKKYIIRIHTMLNRIKIYECDNYFITGENLIINGINIESKLNGTYYYPLHNIEHFNIMLENEYDPNILINDQFNV